MRSLTGTGRSAGILRCWRSPAARRRGCKHAIGVPVYVGMRHWHPFIRETVAQMVADDVRRCIAICMAPHYSTLSIGAYRARLAEALASAGSDMAVDFVESWHTQPQYLERHRGQRPGDAAPFSGGRSCSCPGDFHSAQPAGVDPRPRRSVPRTASGNRDPIGGSVGSGARPVDVQLPERRANRHAVAGAADRGIGARVGDRPVSATCSSRRWASSLTTWKCCTTWISACSGSLEASACGSSAHRCSMSSPVLIEALCAIARNRLDTQAH